MHDRAKTTQSHYVREGPKPPPPNLAPLKVPNQLAMTEEERRLPQMLAESIMNGTQTSDFLQSDNGLINNTTTLHQSAK